MSPSPARALSVAGQQLLLAALVAVLYAASNYFLTVSVIVPVSLMAGLGIAIMLRHGPRSA